MARTIDTTHETHLARTGTNPQRRWVVGVMVVLVLTLASCAAGPNPLTTSGPRADTVGFWMGLWHGFISPWTFLVSLFNDNVTIYEVRNNGGWYNFGFLLGVSAFFSGSGGGNAHRRRRRRRLNQPQDA
jgi:hypothetical protein